MLIWRGWGIIPVLYIVVAVVVSALLESFVIPRSAFGVVLSGLVLVAAVATWFTGVAINRDRPGRKVAAWAAQRRAQLDDLVVSGRFSLGPGTPQPTSLEDAQRMSDDLYAAEVADVTKAARNRHTLFWIPVQYVSFVLAAFAVWCLIQSLIVGEGSGSHLPNALSAV
jgi:hypothetical protein